MEVEITATRVTDKVFFPPPIKSMVLYKNKALKYRNSKKIMHTPVNFPAASLSSLIFYVFPLSVPLHI